MKHLKRNFVMAAVIFAVMIMSVSAVFAAPTVRPVPGSEGAAVTSSGSASTDTDVSGEGSYRATRQNSDDGDDEESGEEDENNGSTGVTRAVPTPIQANPAATMNVVAEKERTEDISNKKYVSRGALAIWILLAVIINTIISFWVGNRFYRLSKKDTHITSEIRALRRDIDEKFVANVGGFSEQETDIENSNEDYSYEDGGITQRPVSKRTTAEEDEEFKKWESRMSQRSGSHSDAQRRRKYQPEREAAEIEDEETKSENPVTSKAKEFLGEMFPFNED